MENKYYQPSIEEFRVGFEYEYYIDELDSDEPGWRKATFTFDYGWIEFPIGFNEDKRVKYLDSEDIESLGFSNYIPPHEYDHTWSKDNYELKCWFNKELPIIRILEYGTIIFHGNIKNRNELKVLLNQLGIK